MSSAKWWPVCLGLNVLICVIMGTMASQTTGLTIVYTTVYSGAGQRKHQSSASLAFVRGIHRGSVNSPHKWLVTRKMFSFDDVIMLWSRRYGKLHDGVIKWKHFPRYWPFVRSPVDSPHEGQWREALLISLICAWTIGWANTRYADDLICNHAHYDTIVILVWNYKRREFVWV